jgi:hypothetical protein
MAGDAAARPRKALAWGLAIFCAVQLSLAAAIEFHAPALRAPVYGRKLNQLQTRLAAAPANAPLVLALGSSQTFDGFDAELLEARLQSNWGRRAVVYNFGLPGAGPLTEWLVLKRLLREGIRPDVLLIEVTPALMHGAEQVAMTGDRLALDELASAAPLASGDDHFVARRWLRSLTPFHTHRESLLRAFLPGWAPQRRWGMSYQPFGAYGWEGIPPTSDAERAAYAAVIREAYRGVLGGDRLDDRSCDCLRRLLDLCRRERLEAALVLMPEASEFRRLNSAAMQSAIEAYLAELAAEYSISCIDARDWMADGDFFDSQHLMAPGARAFMEKLCRRLPAFGPSGGDLAAKSRSGRK